ncbi:MAG: SUMF1/EgtB/PvdO family nonheme iron enzyme [Caldilineaceae bacterium]
MALTGPQFEAIQAALLDAFDEQGLRQLCRIELNEDFDVIVATGPLKRRVFDLITWADRNGRIPQLIAAACRQNLSNDRLQVLRKQYQQWEVYKGVKTLWQDPALVTGKRTAIVFLVVLVLVGLYFGYKTLSYGGIPVDEPAGTQPIISHPTATSSSVAPTIGTTHTNPIDGAVYVYVPAGWFLMGSSDDDPISMDNEQPQRIVSVEAFWIMQTEVTNAQYLRCVEDGACEHIFDSDDPERAQYPVTNVSWKDAKSYAEWAGGRLPTEAQWEKACRGTSGQPYSWGGEGPNRSRANYDDSRTLVSLAKVGSHPAGISPYGALDMIGNAWEWTYGWSQNLGSEPKPQFGYDNLNDESYHKPEPAEDLTHIWRGGAYDFGADYARCAVRKEMDNEARYSEVGFRVVKLGF